MKCIRSAVLAGDRPAPLGHWSRPWTFLSLLCMSLLFWTGARVAAAEDVRITEFLANNFHGLTDEDGSSEDWIEIFNGGNQEVNLNGWYLTDSKSTLKKWKFPSVTLPSGGYRVVFASGKDRPAVFGPMHTNFKLSSKAGGYLALVASNGVTVVSEYVNYPVQVANVSYGFPVLESSVPLLSATNKARVFVPADDRLANSWTTLNFVDGSWTSVSNGFGFETDVATAFNSLTLADSIREFSGNQGASNWFYGYWDRRNDSDGIYASGEFIAFPRSPGPASAANFFTNNTWRWFPADEAVTELDRYGGTATGANGSAVRPHHWAIRRWISETNGNVRISGTIGDASRCADSSLGDGIVARIFVNGVEIFKQPVRQMSMGYSVNAVVTKDAPVDFVIDPGEAGSDQCDMAAFSATVVTTGPTLQLLADSTADWSVTGDQGDRNWYYGFYDRTGDTLAAYQTNDFAMFPDPFWNGTSWAWPGAQPPFDEVGRSLMKPTGATSGGEHWVIRRWMSKIAGTLTVDYHLGKLSTRGGGVTTRVFHRGTQKDSMVISGTNTFGTNRIFTITGVQIGDPIDFVVEPTGTTSSDDVGDDAVLDVRLLGNANLAPFVQSDIKTGLQGVNSSVYSRFGFTVSNPEVLERLALRLRYDSGFVGYLNGVEVLRRNAPVDLTWNSVSTLERPDADAGQFETFDLTPSKDLLKPGSNVLAFQLLNSSAADSDMVLLATLSGSFRTLDVTAQRYFGVPTPGLANGFGNTNLGPLVLEAQHSPKIPKPTEDLWVTARVSSSFNSVSNVQLVYRVMYATEVTVPMLDDGSHGDGVAGDGVYGAVIPQAAYKPGNMVRYYIRAFDVNTNLTRYPVFVKNSPMPEYWGTVVQDPSLTNPLPVLHWFASTAGAVDSGGAASIFFNGQFLDNVRFGVHGQSSGGFSKHSWNVDMNPGYKLTWNDNAPAVDDVNLLTTYPDKAKMRNILAYNTYKHAGTAYHFVQPVQVQFNSAFLGDYHFVENGDDNYLKRVGLDPNGSLYKMYNSFEAADGEHKTRKSEGNGDLVEFWNGLGRSGPALLNYIYDNVNIAEVVNYLASMTITGNTDCCHKNYYFYRDTEITGEWMMLPWDQDLSFGRVWSGGPSYWDDTMHPDTGLRVGGGNKLPAALFANPIFDQMYLRRLRTLMEELMQSTDTPAHLLKYEREIDFWTPQLQPLFAADFARWGTFSGDTGSGSEHDNKNKQTVEEAANIIKFEYLPARRNWLFSQGEIPKGQPSDAGLFIGKVEANPVSGNQDEEFFTIVNTNKIWIDISHWKIRGAVDLEFQGGTVIPTNGTLHVVANTRAFRARAVSPKGAEQRFVQGNFRGHLSARGESLELVDTAGKVQIHHEYPAAPSDAQNSLRITELMYHPAAPPAGSAYTRDDFEYIELRNVGGTALNLAGIRFVNGVEFSFSGSTVTTLAAGQSVLIVKNAAAFASRYGAGALIAGEYSGVLADSGESLRLEDASNEPILDFAYNNAWYPITDGAGFSLVIVNDAASWDTWGLSASWRPSGSVQGSPGAADPAPSVFVPVIINEVLANTPLGQAADFIELLNPGTNSANVGNWYLSDDFGTPKKYKIPANTTIAPGGYLVIRESEYDSGSAGSFGLGADGDEVYLFSANASGQLTGYVTGYEFGASAEGVSLGRYTNSLGQVHFVAQKSVSQGAVNTGPQVGPVVISEIMYHGLETAAGDQQTALEYIEIKNVSGQPVPLFNVDQPTNTWRLTGGADLVFPTNITLPAGGMALLVNFNPSSNLEAKAAFENLYGTPKGVMMFGPYGGDLGNSGEGIALYSPGLAISNAPAPYVMQDWVAYKDASPWPPLADGFGAALVRKPVSAYGNDPINWIAAKPSPGFEETAVVAPQITVQPVSVSPIAGSDLTVSVTATGSEPLAYQWIHDGQPVPGERSRALTLTDIRVFDWGNYQAIVMNAAGAVLSSNAVIIPLQPAVIVKQPQDRNVLAGVNVTFTVTATGRGKLRYQWLYNGQTIDQAVTNSLTIRAVTPASDGRYQVRVTDDVGTTLSSVATLAVFDRPRIVAQPQPVLALAGDDASFSVSVAGRPPFGYRWQRFAVTRTNELLSLNPVSVFTLRNVSLALTGNYSVVITNIVGASTSSLTAPLILLADADGDRLPDSWETSYGLDPANAADAALDSDGDGVSNLDEYKSGTDPKDKNSYLRIDRLNKAVGSTSLEFFAQSNRTYTLEFRESVGAGAWQTLTNVMVRTQGRVETVVDPYPEASGRLYRLVSPALVDRPVKSPVILDSPDSVRVIRGTPISLSVVASGAGTLRYQWYKQDQAIPEATGAILSFGSVAAADQATYTVKVTDDLGNVTSQPSSLVVLEPPTVLQGLQDVTVNAGSPLRLEVKAQGQSPLKYVWVHNGVPIPNLDGPVLEVASAGVQDAGLYTVTIRHTTGNGPVSVELEAVVTVH